MRADGRSSGCSSSLEQGAMTDRRARDLAVVAVVILGAVALSAPIQAQQELTPDEIANLRVRAEHGDAEAQSSLGLIYSDGSGVPRNDVEAVRWYRLAADQGFGPAQVNLGVRYENGRGVPQGYVEAHMWFNLGAAQPSCPLVAHRLPSSFSE